MDPEGNVRYSIFKRLESDGRRARQHAAMTGPLRAFWQKKGRRWSLRPDMMRRLHGAR